MSWALRHRLGLTVSGGGLVQADVLLVAFHVPDHVSPGVLDGQLLGTADKAALGVLEVLPVVEGQLLENLRIGRLGRGGGRFGCDALAGQRFGGRKIGQRGRGNTARRQHPAGGRGAFDEIPPGKPGALVVDIVPEGIRGAVSAISVLQLF